MMYTVNLVRDEVVSPSTRRKVRAISKIALAAAVLSLGMLVFRFVSLSLAISKNTAALAGLRSEMDRYNKKYDTVRISAEWDGYRAFLAGTSEALLSREKVSGLVTALAALPEDSSIVSLEAEPASGKLAYSISVTAASSGTVTADRLKREAGTAAAVFLGKPADFDFEEKTGAGGIRRFNLRAAGGG